MATSSTSRTLSIQPNPKIPVVDTKITRKPFKFSLQWQQKKPSARALIHGGDANTALELNRMLLGPRPRSPPRTPKSCPGLPGAYSELAETKAYPNCEAVPCEQFESVFDGLRWGTCMP